MTPKERKYDATGRAERTRCQGRSARAIQINSDTATICTHGARWAVTYAPSAVQHVLPVPRMLQVSKVRVHLSEGCHMMACQKAIIHKGG